MTTNRLLLGDCLPHLRSLEDNSIDTLITDPPYGYSFLGAKWDIDVPSVEIWQECRRVLKPGSMAFVFSAPRADVQTEMLVRLKAAGFSISFTPLYWVYSNGFPKASNMAKVAAKRGIDAQQLDGAYAGWQPKPAVEVIIVAMKPIEEGTYLDQALANGKSVTWLDDCRIPTADYRCAGIRTANFGESTTQSGGNGTAPYIPNTEGRFPANLLVSDDVLNDGTTTKGGTFPSKRGASAMFGLGDADNHNEFVGQITDEGSKSRFFSLDNWWSKRVDDLPHKVKMTFPFLMVPKASKSEKSVGCEAFEVAVVDARSDTAKGSYVDKGIAPQKNSHPTVKPLDVMSYLVTLGSRPNDVVLDPFMGSGTTGVAAVLLDRAFVGCEMEPNYYAIADARVSAAEDAPKQDDLF